MFKYNDFIMYDFLIYVEKWIKDLDLIIVFIVKIFMYIIGIVLYVYVWDI